MKELLVAPAVILVVLGALTQFEDIALDTSDKALAFSDDMNGAMDCATRGIPIRECSPDLMGGYDFTQEREDFTQALIDLEEQLNQTNVTEV